MADVMTLQEKKGPLATRSWRGAATATTSRQLDSRRGPVRLRSAAGLPEQLQPAGEVLDWARREGARVRLTSEPAEAVAGADCVVTDTWVSMGVEASVNRHNLLAPYRVDERLMANAKPDAIFMHCLPAKRGEEVTAGGHRRPAIGGLGRGGKPAARQKGILAWCLGSLSPLLGGPAAAREPGEGPPKTLTLQRSALGYTLESRFDCRNRPATRRSDPALPHRSFALRGRLVRLGPTIDRILSQHDYPEPVATVLGEAITLAVVLAGALKYDGVFTLADQERRAGAADRGRRLDRGRGARLCAIRPRTARCGAEERRRKAGASPSVPELIGSGYIAFTVDQGEDTERYQGIVELIGATLAECAQHYFRQSEQIQAGIKLSVARSGRAARGGPAG